MHSVRFGTTREYFEVVLPVEIGTQGWARARVRLAVTGFVADLFAFFDKEDFARFASQLHKLNQTLEGFAKLEPLDRQVSLVLSVDNRGRLKLKGDLWSHATFGNKLEFEFELDQTFLQEPLAQVQDALHHWAEE